MKMRIREKSTGATAKVFLAAFRAMPREERRAVIAGIAEEKDLLEDLLDLAVIAQRRNEPSRPLRQYLAERAK
jgi:hypothetical protein